MSSLTALATDISLLALPYFALLLHCVTSTREPQTWHDPREPGQAVSRLSGFHTVLFCIPGNGVETEPKKNVYNNSQHTFLPRSLKCRPRSVVSNSFRYRRSRPGRLLASLHLTSSLWLGTRTPHVIGGARVVVHVVSGTRR
jgi:hypothetical protein